MRKEGPASPVSVAAGLGKRPTGRARMVDSQGQGQDRPERAMACAEAPGLAFAQKHGPAAPRNSQSEHVPDSAGQQEGWRPESTEREREIIVFSEHGLYAAGARHRFLRAS